MKWQLSINKTHVAASGFDQPIVAALTSWSHECDIASLNLHIQDTWKSAHPGRSDIFSKALFEHFKNEGAHLSPPQIPGHSISISHCAAAGGWAATTSPHSIGLDIEEISRITQPIVRRVSDAKEFEQAPDWRFLWPAKEALFKSLYGPAQPQVITELNIVFLPLTPSLTEFEGLQNNKKVHGKGWVWQLNKDLAIALFSKTALTREIS